MNEREVSNVVYGLAFLCYLGACAAPGALAKRRGHEPGNLFVFSFFCSPIMGMLFVLGLPDARVMKVGTLHIPAAPKGPECKYCGMQLEANGTCAFCKFGLKP